MLSDIWSDEARKALFKVLEHDRGGLSMISAEQLLEFYECAASAGLIVDSIEPFKVEEKFDVPHVELTVTPYEVHENYSHLSWNDRIIVMSEIIVDLLRETDKIGGEFRFNARISRKKDWIF